MPKIRSAHHCSHHHTANCLILVLGCRHVIALNFVWIKKHRNLFLLVVSYQASFNWWHSCWSRILLKVLLFLHHSSVIGNSCISPHLIVAVLALIAAIIRWIWWFRVELLEWIVWTLLCLWNLYIYVLSYLNRTIKFINDLIWVSYEGSTKQFCNCFWGMNGLSMTVDLKLSSNCCWGIFGGYM